MRARGSFKYGKNLVGRLRNFFQNFSEIFSKIFSSKGNFSCYLDAGIFSMEKFSTSVSTDANGRGELPGEITTHVPPMTYFPVLKESDKTVWK